MQVSKVSWPGEPEFYQTTEVGITGDQAISTVQVQEGVVGVLVCNRCSLLTHGPATHCRHVKEVKKFMESAQ